MASPPAHQRRAQSGEVANTGDDPMTRMRRALDTMQSEFHKVLPPGIAPEKFVRVGLTALQTNPKLLACDQRSLFNAFMQAATDGLLPDGREGAIVSYGEDEEGRGRADIARWMPMIGGIRKKIRGSGLIADFNAQIVQEGDEFDFALGDRPFIHHKPSLTGGRNRPVIAAYSIATYKDGTISREIMNADQINDVRQKSRARRGPWNDPAFFPEMCRKTVARLHAKQLPTNADLETVFRRDDDMYDLATNEAPTPRVAPPRSARGVLDRFAGGGVQLPPPSQDAAPQNDQPPQDQQPQQAQPPVQSTQATQSPADDRPQQPAQTRSGPPTTEAEYRSFAEGIIAGHHETATDLHEWWTGPAQRKLRNSAGVTKEVFDALNERVTKRAQELSTS